MHANRGKGCCIAHRPPLCAPSSVVPVVSSEFPEQSEKRKIFLFATTSPKRENRLLVEDEGIRRVCRTLLLLRDLAQAGKMLLLQAASRKLDSEERRDACRQETSSSLSPNQERGSGATFFFLSPTLFFDCIVRQRGENHCFSLLQLLLLPTSSVSQVRSG